MPVCGDNTYRKPLNNIQFQALLYKNLLVSDVRPVDGLFLHETEQNVVLQALSLQCLQVLYDILLALLRERDVPCPQLLQKLGLVHPIALHKLGYGLVMNLCWLFWDTRMDLLLYKRIEVHVCAFGDVEKVAVELISSGAIVFCLADTEDMLLISFLPRQVVKLWTDCDYLL